MILLRLGTQRGRGHHGWLESWHSFSFADYVDPAEMGWGALRVINEDVVQPGTGFGLHGHRDMEIVTYLLSGTLEHGDSLGHRTRITRPEVQRMTAGSGIRHSEVNPSDTAPVHLLQIWITPATTGLTPSYEQADFADAAKCNRLCLIASPDGRDGSLTIHQDATLHACLLEAGTALNAPLAPGRRAYVHVVSGRLTLNGHPLASGDGAKILGESDLTFSSFDESEFLLFNLPEKE